LVIEHPFDYDRRVGTNRRYADRIGEQFARRIDQVAVRPQPISLTDDELDKERSTVRAAAEPIPVVAWVRFPETPIRAEARAVAWTDRAVLIEWEHADGRTLRCWVWASAVQRQEPPSR
jgi:hypothetical protein